jgi:hypothetical protein
MSGRPVHLLTAAALAAAASLLPMSSASANCGGCGGYGFVAPLAQYTAPVVYSYAVSAPVSYGSCANPCGYGGYGGYGYAAASPMYVVNQGPSYNAHVVGVPEDVYQPGYAYPSYGAGYGAGYGYGGGYGAAYSYRSGYRGLGWRGGYRGYGWRGGHRGHGWRGGYRARSFGYRSSWRAGPMVGPGAIYRGGMHRMHGPRMGMHGPRKHGPRHMNMHGPRHMDRMPGSVHPMGSGGWRR